MSDEENIKWYTGGVERGEFVTEKLTELISLLDSKNEQPLRDLLFNFYKEIKTSGSSVPYILSRMNISISNCLIDNHIILSKESSDLLKQILKMSQIRYGY